MEYVEIPNDKDYNDCYYEIVRYMLYEDGKLVAGVDNDKEYLELSKRNPDCKYEIRERKLIPIGFIIKEMQDKIKILEEKIKNLEEK